MKTLQEEIVELVGRGYEITFAAVPDRPITRIVASKKDDDRRHHYTESFVADCEAESYRGDLFATTLRHMKQRLTGAGACGRSANKPCDRCELRYCRCVETAV